MNRLITWLKSLWRLIATIVVAGVAFLLFTCSLFKSSTEPAEYGGGFGHLSQGSELFPYDFFPIIERADSEELIINDLESYGLIPDAKDPDLNPFGLPVGLSVARHEGSPLRMMGMTCAACHSGQIEYGGQKREILGAPGMFDADRFFFDLANAAEATLKNPDKRFRFLKRYIGQETGLGELVSLFDDRLDMEKTGTFETELLSEIGEMIDDEFTKTRDYLENGGSDARHIIMTGRTDDVPDAYQPEDYSETLDDDEEITAAQSTEPVSPPARSYKRPKLKPLGKEFEKLASDVRMLVASIEFLRNYAKVKDHATSPPGNGRVDAFGKVRNMVLPLMFGSEVLADTTAPVSYPHLWGTRQAKWLHWNGNTDSVMQRNVLEALGSGAVVDLVKFDSTVNFENLFELENMTHKFEPPVWPEDLLPKIDQEKAALGKQIFESSGAYSGREGRSCLSCHPMAQPYKKGELQEFEQFSLPDMGSDPNHAVNFNAPIAGGHGEFFANIKGLAEKITTRYYDRYEVPVATQQEWEDFREDVDWRSPIDAPLPSRPLNGIWATAPFLHNGSVPTLYDLLLPVDERPTQFTTGSFMFDPVKVGYETDVAGAPFVFDVNAPVVDGEGNVSPGVPNGNSNAGHLFGTDLTDEERWALVEYMKTI